jgi:hypothetical protein
MNAYFERMSEEPKLNLRRSSRIAKARPSQTRKRLRNNLNNKINNSINKKSRRNVPNMSKKQNANNLANTKVKFITKEEPVIKMNLGAGLRFIDEVKSLPIYHILGHSCICPKEGKCFGRSEDKTFKIPKDTYIVSLSTPGDFYCGYSSSVLNNKYNLRDYLYMHSESDIKSFTNNIGKNKFSFFSGVQRATSTDDHVTEYPNITFQLVEFKTDANGKKTNDLVEPEKNELGIYDITNISQVTELNNTMALFPQEPAHGDMYLKDIIQMVYAKTGSNRGIFILGGCMEVCHTYKDKVRANQARASLDEAASLIYRASVMYPTIKPTFLLNELQEIGRSYNIPENTGVWYPVSRISPEEIEELTKSNLTHPAPYLNKLNKLVHRNNLDIIKQMAKKY